MTQYLLAYLGLLPEDLRYLTGLHHDTVNCVKKQLVQTVCLQQMAEFTQCCFNWHGFCHEVDTREFPHGIAIVNSILGGWSDRLNQI